MTTFLIILNLLTLGIIGGLFYFLSQSYQQRLETAVNFYEKIIDKIQAEKIHLYNCFLDKQNRPPFGTDLQKEREQRIEEVKQKKAQQGLQFPIGNSPIKQAQYEAQQRDAGVI